MFLSGLGIKRGVDYHMKASLGMLSFLVFVMTACSNTDQSQSLTTQISPSPSTINSPTLPPVRISPTRSPSPSPVSTNPAQPKVTKPNFEVTRPDHVVIVVEENHSYETLIGNHSAPYINVLAKQGAIFTHSYAVAHPSQPNYFVLFSGSNQGVTDDS